MALYIGTSGYEYPHWKDGVFYPKDLPARQHFAYYSERFNTVEINNTFFGTPRPSVFATWRDAAGKKFVYSVKVPRAITHNSKLNRIGELWPHFESRARYLDDKLSVFLFLIPANMGITYLPRLTMMAKLLHAGGYRAAFEFRNQTWYRPEVAAILHEHGLSVVLTPKTQLDGAASIFFDPGDIPAEWITANYIYIRFHGTGSYSGSYTREYLGQWAEFINKQRAKKRDVYAYFNNDIGGVAPRNARELHTLCTAGDKGKDKK